MLLTNNCESLRSPRIFSRSLPGTPFSPYQSYASSPAPKCFPLEFTKDALPVALEGGCAGERAGEKRLACDHHNNTSPEPAGERRSGSSPARGHDRIPGA